MDPAPAVHSAFSTSDQLYSLTSTSLGPSKLVEEPAASPNDEQAEAMEQERDFVFAGRVHPLLLPHVVDNIISNICLSNEDLLNLRLVCCEWTIAASKEYQRRNSTGERFLYLRLREPRIQTGVLLFENPNCCLRVPSNVFLRYGDFKGYPDEDVQKTFGQFLSLISYDIENLRFSGGSCNFAFDETCYSEVVNFPKLEVADLSGSGVGEQSNFFLCLCETILKRSPVIVYLIIHYEQHGDGYTGEFGDKVLGNIPSSVQVLDISSAGEFRSQDAEAFGALHLPGIFCLKLRIRTCIGFSGTDVHNMFSSYSNKLIALHLCLYGSERDAPLVFKIPAFPKMTRFTLACYCFDRITLPDPGLTFNELFPKATKILSLHRSFSRRLRIFQYYLSFRKN